MRISSPHRRGFTLIWLVILLAIVAIIIFAMAPKAVRRDYPEPMPVGDDPAWDEKMPAEPSWEKRPARPDWSDTKKEASRDFGEKVPSRKEAPRDDAVRKLPDFREFDKDDLEKPESEPPRFENPKP